MVTRGSTRGLAVPEAMLIEIPAAHPAPRRINMRMMSQGFIYSSLTNMISLEKPFYKSLHS
jgi:hypothetical protein